MTTNPYQSPRADLTVDDLPESPREQRTALAAIIRQYLDEEITAFQLDEALQPFYSSGQPTVARVAQELWYFYDDCTDHKVRLSKPAWDYIQRLLLLLESDREMQITHRRRWYWSQSVALVCLVGVAASMWAVGWGPQLYVITIPFGVVSILLSHLRREDPEPAPYQQIIAPFHSFAALSTTYRSTPTFTKRRYPAGPIQRPLRTPVEVGILMLPTYAAWLCLSPIPLLVQTLPGCETRAEVN